MAFWRNNCIFCWGRCRMSSSIKKAVQVMHFIFNFTKHAQEWSPLYLGSIRKLGESFIIYDRVIAQNRENCRFYNVYIEWPK